MSAVFEKVMDALDIETFLVCASEAEGKELALQLVKDMGVDDLYRIVVEEFEALDPQLREGIIISNNSTAVEVNYEGTWQDGRMGIPIFSIEDMYGGSHIIQVGLGKMGVIPTVAYDANIYMSPGLGTTDNNGQLLEDRARYGVKALVRLLEIVSRHAGIIE